MFSSGLLPALKFLPIPEPLINPLMNLSIQPANCSTANLPVPGETALTLHPPEGNSRESRYSDNFLEPKNPALRPGNIVIPQSLGRIFNDPGAMLGGLGKNDDRSQLFEFGEPHPETCFQNFQVAQQGGNLGLGNSSDLSACVFDFGGSP